jgi:transposase
MAELDQQVAVVAQEDPTAKRLQQLRGVGPLIATALVATVGDARQYRKGRDMAAALGLTPRQHSSGGKGRLLGISKPGCSGSVNEVMPICAVYWFTVPVLRCVRPKIRMIV